MYEECDTMIITTNLRARSSRRLDKRIHWESEHTTHHIVAYNVLKFIQFEKINYTRSPKLVQ